MQSLPWTSAKSLLLGVCMLEMPFLHVVWNTPLYSVPPTPVRGETNHQVTYQEKLKSVWFFLLFNFVSFSLALLCFPRKYITSMVVVFCFCSIKCVVLGWRWAEGENGVCEYLQGRTAIRTWIWRWHCWPQVYLTWLREEKDSLNGKQCFSSRGGTRPHSLVLTA